MKKTIFALIAIFLFASTSFAAIEGDYKVEGTGAGGSPYTGTIVINKAAENYILKWQIAKSGEQYSGLGILTGDVLSVAWGSAGAIGVVSYKVERDKLVGTWAAANGLKGTETLTKNKS